MKLDDALMQNVSETYVALAQQAPGAIVERNSSYILCRSSFRHPIGNFAIKLNLERHEIKKLVKLAHSNGSFRIHTMCTDRPSNLATILIESGLKVSYKLTGMVLTRVRKSVSKNVEVAKPSEYHQVVKFIIDNFFWGATLSTRSVLSGIVEKASKENHLFFVTRKSGQIVAAATLTLTGKVAGLYNVCVEPRSRERGYGTEIVQFASAYSRQCAELLVLQTEPELVNWYQEAGFEPLGQMRVFGRAS